MTAGNGVNWKRDLLLVGDVLGKGQAARRVLAGIVTDARTEGKAVQGDPTVSMVRFTPDRTRLSAVLRRSGAVPG
ncbi:hypothetical protein ABZ092_25235 [Streptomyces bobili]|uniref:hypothetical protein n=1 Tax=Streptomyces bobili TaxID=67280 RepID=UPI0033A3D1DD